jgi:hypothetical protein
MAALLMLLTAVDEELGACFFGIMPENLDPFRTEFGVPGDYDPIGAVTVGYGPTTCPRKALTSRRAAGTPQRSCTGAMGPAQLAAPRCGRRASRPD